jgi:hypothetical protein
VAKSGGPSGERSWKTFRGLLLCAFGESNSDDDGIS